MVSFRTLCTNGCKRMGAGYHGVSIAPGLHPRPCLGAAKYRHAQISPDEELLPVVAQHELTFVDVAALRIENVAAVEFRSVPSHTAQDHEADDRRVFPVPRTFAAAFRQLGGIETRFDS